jgi:hypothetical protein
MVRTIGLFFQTLLIILSSVLSVTNLTAANSASTDYIAPLTEWNQPDLQGVWNFASDTPLERPERFGNREYFTPEEATENRNKSITMFEARAESHFDGVGGYNSFWYERASISYDQRTSLITYPINGRLPELIESAYLQDALDVGFDGPEDRHLSERCIVGFNAGPPLLPSSYNNNVQIIQHRDHAVIITEMVHDARIVPLNAGPDLHNNIRLWSGNSRGYWDGETLVVETKNFNDITQSFLGSPYGNSYEKLLTERFTRVDAETIEYEFTIDDPGTFTDKITSMVPMIKVDGLLYDYACHEGNYGMMNILRGARVQESLELAR